MDSDDSCILSLPRMATLAQATKVIFGQHEQLGIWLIGLGSGFYMHFPSPQYWHSTSAQLWFFFLLGMSCQCGRLKRGVAWHGTYSRMENRNKGMRQHSGDSTGSSSSLYSTGPATLPPWHSPWSCPVEWFDLQDNSLGFAPKPIPNDPSSSTPPAHMPVPPPQPQSTPQASSPPCEDYSRLLDTVLILHSLVFELRHDLADIRFKLDLMDCRGDSMTTLLHTLFNPEARPTDVVADMMGATGVIPLQDTAQPLGPPS